MNQMLRVATAILIVSVTAPLVMDWWPTEAQEKKYDRTLLLVVGAPKNLTFDFKIGEIAIGAPSVCSAIADRGKGRIILTPLKAGQTALLVFDTRGRQRQNIRITVTSRDIDDLIRELRGLLGDIEGITIKRVGQKVIIDGEVYLRRDLARIAEVVRGSDTIVSLVKLSENTLKILAKKIQREIDLPGVQVQAIKNKIVIRGEVYNQGDIEKASRIAGIFADERSSIINVLTFKERKKPPSRKQMVQISAYFVELDKEFIRNFNFYWGPVPNLRFEYFAQRRTDGEFVNSMNLLGVVTDVFPRLNTAKALGVARVFENPTVSVKSGDTAVIQGGAELTFPGQTAGGAIVYTEPQEVGVTLNVTPTVVGNDIDMNMTIEVSDFGSQIGPGVIAINRSRVETSQFVRSGQSAAIGGLIRSHSSEARDKPIDPPSSSGFLQIDPNGNTSAQGQGAPSTFGNLFTLFKSRDIQKRRRQFIVFITPSLLREASEANPDLKEHFNIHSVLPLSTVSEEE